MSHDERAGSTRCAYAVARSSRRRCAPAPRPRSPRLRRARPVAAPTDGAPPTLAATRAARRRSRPSTGGDGDRRRRRPGRLLGGGRGGAHPADRPGRARPRRRLRGVRPALRPLPAVGLPLPLLPHSAPRTLAEDLTSETFFRALRSMNNFRWQGKDFGAWLMTIARNLATDHFKAGRTRLELATEDMAPTTTATEGPEDAVLAGLTNEALLEALTRAARPSSGVPGDALPAGPVASPRRPRSSDRSDGAVKQLQLRGVRNLAKLMPEGLRMRPRHPGPRCPDRTSGVTPARRLVGRRRRTPAAIRIPPARQERTAMTSAVHRRAARAEEFDALLEGGRPRTRRGQSPSCCDSSARSGGPSRRHRRADVRRRPARAADGRGRRARWSRSARAEREHRSPWPPRPRAPGASAGSRRRRLGASCIVGGYRRRGGCRPGCAARRRALPDQARHRERPGRSSASATPARARTCSPRPPAGSTRSMR